MRARPTRRLPRARQPPHQFVEDPSAAPDWRGQRPCMCTRPRANAVHQVTAVPPAAQAEHRIRIGEKED